MARGINTGYKQGYEYIVSSYREVIKWGYDKYVESGREKLIN